MQEAFGSGWKVTFPNQHCTGILVGMGVSFDRDTPEEFINLPDSKTVMARLQEVLSSMGMWNPKVESTFGLHGVEQGM